MINKIIFRQYDIRGIVNDDLTYENSKLIGYYLGLHIKEKNFINAIYCGWL